MFSFWRNLHTLLQGDCAFSRPPKGKVGSFFSTPSLAFIICSPFDDDLLTSARWQLIGVLNWTSLIIRDVVHLFTCLLPTGISSLDNCLLRLCNFFNLFKFIFTYYSSIHWSFFILGWPMSSLLCMGFLQLWRAGASLHCSVTASHCGGFSCCRAQALGVRASVVAYSLSICSA